MDGFFSNGASNRRFRVCRRSCRFGPCFGFWAYDMSNGMEWISKVVDLMIGSI